MKATVRRADEETATAKPAVVDYRADIRHFLAWNDPTTTCQGSRWHAGGDGQPSLTVMFTGAWAAPFGWRQDEPSAHLMAQCQGSAGIVSFSADYAPLLPHVGSSSLIVDRRSGLYPHWVGASVAEGSETLAVVDQLNELRAALSLNKSQLARVMRVTRPTIYEWYEGKDPNATNSERIRTLLHVLQRSAVSGARPLNARFVRQSVGPTEPALLDLLCEPRLDQARVARALKRVRALGNAALRKRRNREDRLRALGFEDPDGNQRKEQLARNVALQDWPKQ